MCLLRNTAKIDYIAMMSNITLDSKNKYKRVKYYYKTRKWSLEQVYNAVGRWITPNEYQKITNENYTILVNEV